MAHGAKSKSNTFLDDEESQPLTSKPGQYESRLQDATHQARGLTWSRAYVAALHLVLVCLAAVVLHGPASVEVGIPVKGRSWSPVHPFLDYEVRSEHADHKQYNSFSGPPTTETDNSWEHLLKPVAFNATLEELQMANESTDGDMAKLSGGGYLASLSVYHELHCLRRFRHYLYREHYFHNLTQTQEEYVRGHLDHCIEALRLTIMCHGNTEVYSFEWDDPESDKPAAKSNGKSVCVKWSSIEDWAYSRITTYDDIIQQIPVE